MEERDGEGDLYDVGAGEESGAEVIGPERNTMDNGCFQRT